MVLSPIQARNINTVLILSQTLRRGCWPAFAAGLSLNVMAAPTEEFIGSGRCVLCHQAETAAWRGSHHERAMLEATNETVLGDFDRAVVSVEGITSTFFRRDGDYIVRTEGPTGHLPRIGSRC